MLSKALKLTVRTLDVRQPSMIFRLKATNTPLYPLEAISMAHRQLSAASDMGAPRGSWLPVRTMGMGGFCSMKDSMEAV